MKRFRTTFILNNNTHPFDVLYEMVESLVRTSIKTILVRTLQSMVIAIEP